MVIASCRNIQVIPVRHFQHLIDELWRKAGIERFHALQSEPCQPLQALFHILADHELIPAAIERVGKHRDSFSGKDSGDGLLRAQVFISDTQLVDVVDDGFLFGCGISVLHHEVADMGLPGVIHGQKLLKLFLGKHKAELVFDEIEPGRHLFHAKAVALINKGFDCRQIGIVPISQNMIGALVILA